MEGSREQRSGVDRRSPGARPYHGVERRTGSRDRRGQFGKASVLLERGGVRINDENARIGQHSFRIAEVESAEISKAEGQTSLSWALYGLLACVTALQAGLENHGALWAIAAALALLSTIAWRRRSPPALYTLTVEAAGERTAVLQSADGGEVRLICDALHMATASR